MLRRSNGLMLRATCLAFCTAGTMMWATAAAAADRDAPKNAQTRYQKDRAACLSGQTNQDQATCLREAGAAAQEARRGGLTSGEPENRYDRCDPLPGDQKLDCIRRMNGEGITRGSVEEGGIYRELRTIVPAPTSSLQ